MTNANDVEPKVLDIPIGLDATGMRREFDSLGDVDVPADRYWGAQTQRSLQHFNIGHDRMPKEVYHAYGYVKKAAAVVNTPDSLNIRSSPVAPNASRASKGSSGARISDVAVSSSGPESGNTPVTPHLPTAPRTHLRRRADQTDR